MVETSTAHDEGAAYRSYGRIPAYWIVGFLILIGFALGAVLAWRGVTGPGLVTAEVAGWVLGLWTVLVGLGLLYVLFTLRATLRIVREQATQVAVVRSRQHYHVPTAAAPPAVEYQAPAQAPSRSVEVIEGIGPVFRRRLERSGIETLRDLRAVDDSVVARRARVPRATARRWKAMADLLVLPELDAQSAEVLVAAGIGSIDRLASQDPVTLHRNVRKANTENDIRLASMDFSRATILKWIDGAQRFTQHSNGPVRVKGRRGPPRRLSSRVRRTTGTTT